MRIIDIFFPQRSVCMFCDNEESGFGICNECYNSLPFINGHTCDICGGRVVIGENFCTECKKYSHEFLKNFSILDYDENIRKKILSFKQYKHKEIGEMFSHIVEEYFSHIKRKFDVIIPVPIHENRLKVRGFNQSEILTSRLKNVDTKIIRRIKDTPHQTGLSRKNRQENLLGAFEIIDSSKIENKTVLIFDDIFTTGATLDECAKILYEAGAKRVYCMSLARGVVD